MESKSRYVPSEEEKEFLAHYDPGDYPRPSVTADIIIFTICNRNELHMLLIKRGGYPQKGFWALPGGFINAGKESTDEAAARELKEETGIEQAYLNQLYTFSAPNRDPRTHVISVAYLALIPRIALSWNAGDDAADAKLFHISDYDEATGELTLHNYEAGIIHDEDLAFDHAEIIRTAIRRIRGRISYELDAFELLKDKQCFTIYELKLIHEAILGKKLNTSNFRKMFQNNYMKTGLVESLGKKGRFGANPEAMLFRLNQL